MQEHRWISNKDADEIVCRLQQSGCTDTRVVQQFLDAISGVKDYSLTDNTQQGNIKRIFEKECFKQHGGAGQSSFSISIEDMISIFWESVFRDLPNAKTHGSTVNTRLVKGQDSAAVRQTNCNPINWLKMRGVMGIRNAINKIYSKYLFQTCDDCGHQAKPNSVESTTLICPKCSSQDTVEHWPDGTSMYRSTKERKCNTCGGMWKREFAYACTCGSANVHIESRFNNAIDTIDETADGLPTIEERHVGVDLDSELVGLIAKVYSSLPTNPDPKCDATNTKTRAILDILCNSPTSSDICSKCVARAPVVCSEQCHSVNCIHSKVPDPKQTCGATSFSLISCINYNKKLGEYQGVSATLSSRYFIKYIEEHRDDDLCSSLHRLLSSRGLLNGN
jgi:hypothetical protein